MTKARDPLTIADAVTDIAKELGWEQTAALFGVTVRTVAYWSDPEDLREPSLKQALALDAAYRAKTGSDHAPIQAAYAFQLDLLHAPVGNRAHLRQLVGTMAKESGDAVFALVQASEDPANPNVIKDAVREIDEASEAFSRARSALCPQLRVVGGQ